MKFLEKEASSNLKTGTAYPPKTINGNADHNSLILVYGN